MDCQDWTTVTVRRHYPKKEIASYGFTRDANKNEKPCTTNLVDTDSFIHKYNHNPKKRINSESLQALIRKRIEIKLTQEGADIMCSFPCNTFKDIESNRLIPSEDQIYCIQQKLNIQLRFNSA